MVDAVLEGDLPPRHAPERIAAMALRILGASEEEIASLISRPLPKVKHR